MRTNDQPSSANPLAISRPMPRLAPVTMATSGIGFGSFSFGHAGVLRLVHWVKALAISLTLARRASEGLNWLVPC